MTASSEPLPASPLREAISYEVRSPLVETLRRLRRHRSFQIGIVLLSILVFIAVFANVLAPYDPTLPLSNVTRRDTPCIHALDCTTSAGDHLFGIDGNNRDEFSRILFGARLSLQIGFTTTGVAIIIGTLLGAIAGYAGGWIDTIIMRFMDILLAFPSLLLAIAIVAVLGQGLLNALIAIAIVNIPIYARLFRASVLSVKELEYVTASRAVGASPLRILWSEIVPNSMTPVIVQGTLGIATTILDAAGLSFLGLGAQPPTAEWGVMLSEERNSIFTAAHLVFIPGIAIMLTVLSFNLIGDALRDALDPRLRID
jgi:ABC-type dipeptide/oligopeptide/nickel transport system permease subunit